MSTRVRPASSATKTSKKIEILPVASLYMILSEKRIKKALIRLRGCAGLSTPVLFANPRRQVLSRRGQIIILTSTKTPTCDKMRALQVFCRLFAASSINVIIQEQEWNSWQSISRKKTSDGKMG